MKKEYIFKHTPTSDELVDKIRKDIPNFISGKRLNHTFFVEKEAITIAQVFFLVYNISVEYLNDIRAAALLHDMTKQMDMEKQLDLCREFGIDADSYISDAIIHGKTAAFLARKLYGINDVVFSAIYSHTTGNDCMNIFDKIIFLADYTEESRTHEHCITTRTFLHNGLLNKDDDVSVTINKAILLSIDGTLSHLIGTGKEIDIQTVRTRNFILNSLNVE